MTSNTFAFEFRTANPSGLLLYTPPETFTNDFLAVYLDNNSVVFTYDSGDGLATLRSAIGTFNDDLWHNVSVSRFTAGNSVISSLQVDGRTSTGQQIGVTDSSLDASEALYIGGFPVSSNLTAGLATLGIMQTYEGCIDDISVDGSALRLGAPFNPTLVRLANCDSTKFDTAAAYVKHAVNLTKPRETIVNLEFQTSSSSGSVFYVDGFSSNFLGIGLNNGRLLVQQDLGDGVVTAESRSGLLLNNSQPWRIQVVRTGLQTIVIFDSPGVTQESFVLPSSPQFSSTELSSNGDVYVGGISATVSRTSFSALYRDGILGCVLFANINAAALRPTATTAVSTIGVEACSADCG